MSFCLSTHTDNLLGMNQTKYLIRPIIIIIIIITLLIGNFFQICSYFIKLNSLEWAFMNIGPYEQINNTAQ